MRQSSIDTQPSVHRYLRRRVGERLAEELTAETFTRAFRARQQFDISQASALPWLYGIAVNLVMMHLRSEHRRERAYRLFGETPIQPSSTTEADGRLDANALGSVLKEALAALSPDQREVLLLHAWGGRSHAEITEALSVQAPSAANAFTAPARRPPNDASPRVRVSSPPVLISSGVTLAVCCYEVGVIVGRCSHATDSVIHPVVSATRPFPVGGVDDAPAVLVLELV